jgi:putative FmdB family regulatory protein
VLPRARRARTLGGAAAGGLTGQGRCYCQNVPIYEYRCPNGHVFELVQRIGDAPPPGCEVCDEGPLERVLYPVAVHFKGSGFYSTDYGRGSTKKETPSKDGAGGDSDAGASKEKKSEPKPAET